MTSEQKRRCDVVRHVVHEYANFVSSSEMVLNGTDIDGVPFKPPINTHISHAFYLNCRKLADFFNNVEGPHGDDVLVKHYVPAFVATLPTCGHWRGAMNKQLAHITFFRDGTGAREIAQPVCEALYSELKATWKEFRNALPEPYRSEFMEQIRLRQQPYSNGTPSEFRNLDLE